MSDLVLYPDSRLRTVCEVVENFDDRLRELGDQLVLAAQEAKGLAMAAPQLRGKGKEYPLAVFAYLVGERKGVVCNPHIVALSDDSFVYKEGCLSIPHHFWYVSRPNTVTIEYQETNGEHCVLTDDGVFGRMLQHEVDHLNGVLVVDHLTRHEKKQLAKELAA